MAKLTKAQAKLHEKAVKLLQCKELSEADTRFIFDHYREDANHINSTAGAFFTPYGLARDFRLHIPLNYKDHVKLIDLCAGIGILSYMAARACDNHNQCSVEITCIEINQDYVDVGKQLLPEATWICSDALDPALLSSLGHFDCAISNPPFGRIHSPYRRNYSSSQFEYMVIEAAASIADAGVFIIPQISAPFVYSGTNNVRWRETGPARLFEQQTGIELDFNVGIDTSQYQADWHGTSPHCEIVCCDFTKRTGQLAMMPLNIEIA